MVNELHNQSMEKLKTDRSDFDTDDIFSIVGFINDYEKVIPEEIINQIKKDVGIYKKYDAIAMWVGVGGLIEYESEFITELVRMFGIEE